jgi:hypothetical protein
MSYFRQSNIFVDELRAYVIFIVNRERLRIYFMYIDRMRSPI